jgi:hypothetical protein
MAETTRPRKRLSHVAVTGLKEIPANAAWVLAKALRPATEGASTVAEHVSDAASSAASGTRSASACTRGNARPNSPCSRRAVANCRAELSKPTGLAPARAAHADT